MKEIVLPSGRFATLRPITWWDKVVCATESTDTLVFLIACRVVKIDGAELTFEQAKLMTLEDAQPIINSICAEMVAGLKAKGVA